jgi:hypothetical protein
MGERSVSRVEEQQQKAQAETERAQKAQDRATRDAKKTDESRQRFGELLKKGGPGEQVRHQQVDKNLTQKQGEQVVKQQLGQAKESAREARLARGGVVQHQRLMEQVKSFQGTLESRRAETEQGQKARVETRDEGLHKTREATEERVGDLDKKKETRAERDKDTKHAEAKAQGRVNAAIDGAGQKRGDGGGASGNDASAQQASKAVGGVQAADGAAAAHEVKQIPEQILEALAQEVYVGVNERGLAEFRVELKEGVLQGASLRVEADGGKIRLRFEGLSGHAKNLVSASEGDLARRLAAKGLHLDALVV